MSCPTRFRRCFHAPPGAQELSRPRPAAVDSRQAVLARSTPVPVLAVCLSLLAVSAGCSRQPSSPVTPAAPPASPVPTAAADSLPTSVPPTADDAPTSAPASAESTAATEEQAAYARQWQAASQKQRREMADLSRVGPLFVGVSAGTVQELLGEPTFAGVDKFGSNVLRYELGDVPAADGGGQYHVTFMIEDGGVTSVLGNSMTISP